MKKNSTNIFKIAVVVFSIFLTASCSNLEEQLTKNTAESSDTASTVIFSISKVTEKTNKAVNARTIAPSITTLFATVTTWSATVLNDSGTDITENFSYTYDTDSNLFTLAGISLDTTYTITLTGSDSAGDEIATTGAMSVSVSESGTTNSVLVIPVTYEEDTSKTGNFAITVNNLDSSVSYVFSLESSDGSTSYDLSVSSDDSTLYSADVPAGMYKLTATKDSVSFLADKTVAVYYGMTTSLTLDSDTVEDADTATIYYVSGTAEDDSTGDGSYNNPYSLTAAITAAESNTSITEIRLLTDITLTAAPSYSIGTDVIIDMNNHTLKFDYEDETANFTTADGSFLVTSGGSLIVENGTIDGCSSKDTHMLSLIGVEEADSTNSLDAGVFSATDVIFQNYAGQLDIDNQEGITGIIFNCGTASFTDCTIDNCSSFIPILNSGDLTISSSTITNCTGLVGCFYQIDYSSITDSTSDATVPSLLLNDGTTISDCNGDVEEFNSVYISDGFIESGIVTMSDCTITGTMPDSTVEYTASIFIDTGGQLVMDDDGENIIAVPSDYDSSNPTIASLVLYYPDSSSTTGVDSTYYEPLVIGGSSYIEGLTALYSSSSTTTDSTTSTTTTTYDTSFIDVTSALTASTVATLYPYIEGSGTFSVFGTVVSGITLNTSLFDLYTDDSTYSLAWNTDDNTITISDSTSSN